MMWGNTIGSIVDGKIYNHSKHLIPGVKLQLLNDAGQPIGDPVTSLDGSYEIDTSEFYYDYVLFTADGYIPLKVAVSILEEIPDQTLSNQQIPIATIAIVLAIAYAISRKKKKAIGSFGPSEVMTILLAVGGVIGIKVLLDILKKFGLGGDGGAANEEQNPNSAWKPGYWKQFSTFTYAITTSTAKAYAKQIHEAFTLFQDDYNVILSVFSQLRTKANVSYIADQFNQLYNEDLLSFLTDGGGVLPWDGLSTDHLHTIINLVSKLPSN